MSTINKDTHVTIAGSISVPTGLFINNKFVKSVSGKKFAAVDPSTGDVITEYYEADKADVDLAVEAAKAARHKWAETPAAQRAKLLFKLADLIERDTHTLAVTESLDNGKTVKVAMAADLPLAADCYRFYAGYADKVSGMSFDQLNPGLEKNIRYEPYGVCGQIIPWNFPILMQAWKLAPALAAGNVVVLKSSEKTPINALRIAELIVEAGFPPGVVNILSGYGPTAGNAIASHPDIRKVAFTGSTATGRRVVVAAANSNLKKVSLELGGKSPNIIFPDADMKEAVAATMVGIYFNQGQVCCAGSRVFVHEDCYDQFVAAFKAAASSMKIGKGSDPESDIGPLVDDIQFKRVMDYIEAGKKEGAKCEVGGARHGDKGYFVQPTLFTGVEDDHKIAQEEIFGPVVCVFKFKTLDEVVERANNTEFGLAAAVHTKNVDTMYEMQRRLEAGTVWCNCYNVFSNSMAFGGYKQSGFGRELGPQGILEYLQVKAVFVAHPVKN